VLSFCLGSNWVQGFWLADRGQRDAGHNPDANLKFSQGFGSACRSTASGSPLVVAFVSAKNPPPAWQRQDRLSSTDCDADSVAKCPPPPGPTPGRGRFQISSRSHYSVTPPCLRQCLIEPVCSTLTHTCLDSTMLHLLRQVVSRPSPFFSSMQYLSGGGRVDPRR
jgi:hypothetical protein